MGLMNSALTGTATELTANRGRSRLGSIQCHLRLDPPLDGHSDVAVTHGESDVYVFAADPETGDIIDPSAPLRRLPDTDIDAALECLGCTAH